jgi:hypothetical protein
MKLELRFPAQKGQTNYINPLQLAIYEYVQSTYNQIKTGYILLRPIFTFVAKKHLHYIHIS